MVVATPGEHRLIPAPCGVSFHVDMLDPRILMVRDVETGEESIHTVLKAFTLDGRYLATYAVEGSEGAEPLSAANGLVCYVAPLCGEAGESPPQTSSYRPTA